VPDHLLAMSEVASLLGMSKQGLAKLLERNPDFPEPTAVLSVGRIWNRADVEAWMAAHPDRRTGRPRTGQS
jgi:predicted DNA-binding transcriptional regulator AlpA